MMMIESHDVDFSNHASLGNFPGPEMIPWLEYLPPDVLNYFGETGGPVMEPGGVGPSGPPGLHAHAHHGPQGMGAGR